MSIRKAAWLVSILACATASELCAQDSVTWNSGANAVNQTSSGSAMDGTFRFELGVFTGTFVPTALNMADWAANWKAAQRISYNAGTKRFAASFTPPNNSSPFTAGKDAYVWGFRGTPSSGEWILFRASTWKWPSAVSFPPALYEWFAKDAVAVVGAINAGGSPFLMKSAAVTNVAPPPTTFAQWQADSLSGVTLSGPNDDPDKDGVPNLLEYVFGTSPKVPQAQTATPASLVAGHLRITVPRRIDHPATLAVEVSSDLKTWNSGTSYTQVVSDTLSSLVVEDLTTQDASHPNRFIRLRAEITTP